MRLRCFGFFPQTADRSRARNNDPLPATNVLKRLTRGSIAAPRMAQEFFRGAGVGPARVRVADVGREEFEEAHAGTLAGGRDEGRECD